MSDSLSRRKAIPGRMLHFKNSWLIERLVFLSTFKSQNHPYFRAIERLIVLEKVKKQLKMTDLIVFSIKKYPFGKKILL